MIVDSIELEHLIVAQNLVLLVLIPFLIWRANRRLVRRNWDNWDKRLSEILWAVRKSEPTELRKQAVRHEEQWQGSVTTMKELAATLDEQVKKLTAEVTTGSAGAKAPDLADIRQNAAVLHVLERISKQLTMLDDINDQLGRLKDLPGLLHEQVPQHPKRTYSKLRAGSESGSRSTQPSADTTAPGIATTEAPDVGSDDAVDQWKKLYGDIDKSSDS